MTARAAMISRALLALICGALGACASFDAQWQAAGSAAPGAGGGQRDGGVDVGVEVAHEDRRVPLDLGAHRRPPLRPPASRRRHPQPCPRPR